MKRRYLVAIVVLLVFLGSTPFACVAYQIHRIRNKEKTLLKPEVYEVVARIMINYCQMTTSNVPIEIGSSQFPAELQSLDRLRGVYVSSLCGSVDFGGGFYGYGYQLSRDEIRSNEDVDHWILRTYSSTKNNNRLVCIIERDRKTGAMELYKEGSRSQGQKGSY